MHAGATPVFADVDPGHAEHRPGGGRGRRSGRAPGGAAGAFRGRAVRHGCAVAIAREHSLPVIEDAAHAVEATVGDRRVGSIGDFTCFSLYATKSLAGGEGGVVTTGRPRTGGDAAPAAVAGHHARPVGPPRDGRPGPYDVLQPGFKANLADLQAAVAMPKLERIEPFTRDPLGAGRALRRRARLAARDRADCPPAASAATRYHLYVVRIDPALAGGDRDRLRRGAEGREHLHRPALPARAPALLVPGATSHRRPCRRRSWPAPRCCRCPCPALTTQDASTTRWRPLHKLHAAFTR